MSETIIVFGRELLADSIASVDLKRPPYERKLIWKRVQTTLAVAVGGVFAYAIYHFGSYWYFWLMAIGGLINIPFAIGAWATRHEPKWQVSVKYTHQGETQTVESHETAYFTRSEAVASAQKIFDEMQAKGMGEAHRLAFMRRYPNG